VWQVELDDYGLVVHALIHEAQGRWREWFPTYSVVWVLEQDGDSKDGSALKNEGQPVVAAEVVPHPFGQVPLVPFVANDSDPNDTAAPLGESAIKATAQVDLRILNHLSLLDDLHRKTGFAILHLERDPDQGVAADFTLGNGFAFAFGSPIDWKAPPSDLAAALWSHVDKLESLALKIGGVHRRSMDSVEAHSGLALDWENAPIYATVQRWARRLREWELRLWRLMAVGLGKRAPSDLDVIYPDDFSSRPIEQDLDAAKRLLEPYGSYESAPRLVQVAVLALHRRVARRLIGADAEVAKVIAEPLVADEPDEAAPTAEPQGDEVSAEMADREAARAELEFKAKMLEQLVKARAPQELGRAVLRAIASDMGIDSPEVQRAINDAILEWYTTPPAEVGDLAELQGEDVAGTVPKKPVPPPSPFGVRQPQPVEPNEDAK
jgi:hypothetical protein